MIESENIDAPITEMDWKSWKGVALQVQKLEYRTPGTISVPATLNSPLAEGDSVARVEQAAKIAELEARIEADSQVTAKAIEAAKSQGFKQGFEAAEQQGSEASRQAMRGIEKALAAFDREREEYFSKVEAEVVQLALAIAARILHREAQIDPLLLSGAVRVALGQLGESTGVRLRVPTGEAELWSEMLRLLSDLRLRPEVVADGSLLSGECQVETQVGTVDLGVKSQLAEIERGFFDLLDHRPKHTQRLQPSGEQKA